MSLRLYEVLDSIRTILGDTDDGELAPDAEAKLAALQLSLEDKCDNTMRYVQECQATATALEAESKRLDDLAKSAWGKADRMRRFLKESLENAGIGRLDTALFKLSIVRNSQPSVRLAEGAEIPAEYARVKTELDSRKVAEAFRAGWDMPPGVTCEVGSHLRTR